jgi:hypothetical protein
MPPLPRLINAGADASLSPRMNAGRMIQPKCPQPFRGM